MSVNQSLQVTAIPAFDDNYLWLIHDQEYAAIVDPGDAAAVEAALATHQLKLAAIYSLTIMLTMPAAFPPC